MIKTTSDLYLDEYFRQAYGPSYTWDSDNDTLALRKGVGNLEDGPSIPKATIPTGKVAQKLHEVQEIPTAVSPSTVARVDLGFRDAFDDAQGNNATWERAVNRARSYISSKS